MDNIFQDVRHAFRMLSKSPSFTVLSLVVLALGIGANTAMFSVINAVLLRSLPYGESERLVAPVAVIPAIGGITTSVPYKDYLAWKKQKNVFEQVAVAESAYSDLSSQSGPPERVTSAQVSLDFFTTLQATPVLGRTFEATDHLDGAEKTVVISERLWKRKFGGDISIIGRRVRLRGSDCIVIGVASNRANFPLGTDVWLPVDESTAAEEPVDNFAWSAVARLAPGVSAESARSFVATNGDRMAREFAANRTGTGTTLVSLTDAIVGPQVKQGLLVLFAAVGFVLLIAAANLANLLLNRATARSREFAVRSALGASRGRIVRQVLVEAAVLSLCGAVLGLLLAASATELIVRFGPNTIPRLDETSVDVRVLVFSVAVALFTALIFALAPALRASSQHLLDGLQQGSRATSGPRSNMYRDCLAVTEMALSLALLVCAGLMIKSFGRLERVDPGVSTKNLLTFELAMPRAAYSTDEKRARLVTDFRRKMESIPGVESVGGALSLPMGGGSFYLGRAIIVEGQPKPPSGTEYPVMWNTITPGFIKSAGLQLLKGRDFTERDTATASPVAIISKLTAKQVFGDADPIGKYLRSWRDDNKPREVVGVVADIKIQSLDEQAQAGVYVPYEQDPSGVLAFVVRTKDVPGGYIPLIRRELDSLDPTIAIANASTMTEIRNLALAQPKFNMMLVSAFSALALILAVVGLFGVVAYSVSQRTREIGIRVALGADRAKIVRLVLARGLRLTLLGLGAGVVLSLLASRLVQGLLFQVRPVDPLVYLSLCLTLALTGALASYIPARRATRIEPLEALRYE